jgi:hypothetical protein
MRRVYVLHECREWFQPLGAALAAIGVPYEEWFLDGGPLALGDTPPDGIFFNRLSASAHTRNHPLAVEQTRTILRWLAAHGRRVVNGGEALELAMSKAALLPALAASGLAVPESRVAFGPAGLAAAAEGLEGPFLVKPNRSGKGIGIERFESVAQLRERLAAGPAPESVDGVYLVQRYLAPRDPFITRLEFVGGRLLYALRSGLDGGFNLCPADFCALPAPAADRPRFTIDRAAEIPELPRYLAFLRRHRVEVAAIEFLVDRDGRSWTYDLNINTNYNAAAEAAAGVSGMAAIAAFLGRTLASDAGPLLQADAA